LWFRKDTNGTYRLMTNEEYSKDLVIHKIEETKIYSVYGPNLEFIAEAIQNLYGERVKLTYSGGQSSLSNSSDSDNSDSNSNNSRNDNASNSSSSGSGASSSDSVTERLSVDQLAGLRLEGSGMNVVSGQALDNLTAQR
jgi:hypothetical protein